MADGERAFPLDGGAFREVIRHPKAHAHILGQYRIGEYAGVVALKRLLGELEPDAKLGRAMEIHYGDEARHTAVFTDWIRRLGVEPATLPENVEGYFANSPEEFQAQRQFVETLPAHLRRVIVFAGINAIERIAYNQFELHLSSLDRADDVEALQQVMREEKFHLNYVEGELDRQVKSADSGFVEMALTQAREGFARFQQTRQAQTRDAIERILGGQA